MFWRRLFSSIVASQQHPPKLESHISRVISYHARRDPLLLRSVIPSSTGLPPPDIAQSDYLSWKPITDAPSLRDSLHDLADKGVVLPDYKRNLVHHSFQPPTWLVVFILCYKVTTPHDALIATRLVRYHFFACALYTRPLLLSLTAAHLVEHQFIQELKDILFLFLRIPPDIGNEHMNFMLRTIGRLPASKASSRAALKLLKPANSRNVQLEYTTLAVLSKPNFVTPILASSLLITCNRLGERPRLKWLQTYTMAFAKAGCVFMLLRTSLTLKLANRY